MLRSDRFATDTRVAARRRLTVEEIVARHQAAAVRQAASVRTLISSGTLTITFEAPGFPAPVTVSSETTIFKDATRTDLEQREIRVNGIAFRSQGIPRLPIIEPERVSAPPLAITLGDKYRYRLIGDEPISGVRAYVVAFEPLSGREPLFRGRAWISAEDFGIVRVEASETGLRGPVVSSEQVDEFTRTAEGAWVLERSDVRQLYQGAAYRTPIRRVLALPTHDVNAPDFDVRRQTAYASEHTILRDTSAGYRYLEGETRRAASTGDVELASEQGALLARPRACGRSRSASLSIRTSVVRCRSRASAISTSTCSAPERSSMASSAARTGSWPSPSRHCAAAAGSSRAARSASRRPTTTGTSRLAGNNTIGTYGNARRSRQCGCCVR